MLVSVPYGFQKPAIDTRFLCANSWLLMCEGIKIACKQERRKREHDWPEQRSTTVFAQDNDDVRGKLRVTYLLLFDDNSWISCVIIEVLHIIIEICEKEGRTKEMCHIVVW
jgi:hypothetical protein